MSLPHHDDVMKDVLPDNYWSQHLKDKLFPKDYSFVPNTSEIFEWELAYMEMMRLSRAELIARSAYFSFIDKTPTMHYQLCSFNDTGIHHDRNIATQAFFQAQRFSTGYATHGLFPYRGKFHPQLVKGIINIIGLKRDDLLLDPMAGSGTTCLEARLLGINSIGVDVSPFCILMSEAKSLAMEIDPNILYLLIPDRLKFLDFITRPSAVSELPFVIEKKMKRLEIPHDDSQIRSLSKLVMLIYLDAMGYARRNELATLGGLFGKVFDRYVSAIENFREFTSRVEIKLGRANFLRATALALPIKDESADGVVTSPPYSFAIDYVDNDKPQLEFLGCKIDSLKKQMIGLRGRTKHEKIEQYFQDMRYAIREISRVLKPNKICVIVVGSNDIQTGGIRHEVEFKKFAEDSGLKVLKEIVKPIKGIQNTMHEEHILFFQKAA